MTNKIDEYFTFQHDEDGLGWYKLDKFLDKSDWFKVKKHFEYVRGDFFIKGWATLKPEEVIKILEGNDGS